MSKKAIISWVSCWCIPANINNITTLWALLVCVEIKYFFFIYFLCRSALKMTLHSLSQPLDSNFQERVNIGRSIALSRCWAGAKTRHWATIFSTNRLAINTVCTSLFFNDKLDPTLLRWCRWSPWPPYSSIVFLPIMICLTRKGALLMVFTYWRCGRWRDYKKGKIKKVNVGGG